MHRFWDIVTRPLLDALSPATMLEIGAEDGLHTRLLLPYAAAKGAHLTVVDPILNERLAAVLGQHPDHAAFVGKPSLKALETLNCPAVALIDGDHNWYTVYHELQGLANAAARDGVPFPVCLFHDIGWPYARRDLYYDPKRIPAEFRHPCEHAGIVPGQAQLDPNSGLNRRYLNATEEGGPRNGVLTAVEDFAAEYAEPLALFQLPVMAGFGILIRKALLDEHPDIARHLAELTAPGALKDLAARVDDDRIAQTIKLEDKRVGEAYLRGRVQQEQEAARSRQEHTARSREELATARRELLLEQARHRLTALQQRARDLAFVLDAGRLHAIADRTLLDSSRWKVGDRLVSLVETALRMPRRSQSPVHMAAAHAQLEAAQGQFEELGIRERLAEMDKRLSRASDDQAFQSIQRDLSEMQQDVARLLRQSVEAFERAHEFSQMVQRSTRWRLGALVMGVAAKVSPRPVPTTIPASIEALAHTFHAWKGAGGVPGMTPLPKPAETAVAQGSAPIPKMVIDSVRITQFTPPSPRNPFFTLVPHELARRGWHLDYMVERDALLERVRKGAFKHEVVLFHHLDPLYHDRGGDAAAMARNAGALIAFFEQLAAAGAQIVYNAHNPVPHASPDVKTDLKVQDAMHRLAARVIVLGESARDDLANHVAPEKVAVLPHPTFAGHYGPPVERSEARAKLGLPADAFILGSVGELKPYKGIPLLLEGYRRFRAAHPDSPAHLVIAGREGKPGFADEVRAQLPPDATLHAGEIPDSELPVWLGALDLSVFGFERMWVSSTVLLSLSYGVPVIAPDVGCFHEYAPEEDRGFLYEPGDADALAAAMQRAVDSPLLPHMRYLCGVFNKKFAVTAVADRYERFYAALAEPTEGAPHV